MGLFCYCLDILDCLGTYRFSLSVYVVFVYLRVFACLLVILVTVCCLWGLGCWIALIAGFLLVGVC